MENGNSLLADKLIFVHPTAGAMDWSPIWRRLKTLKPETTIHSHTYGQFRIIN